ncbi:CatB-related O-acetyltransferase [Aliigemmobacter aestuarii]|uniref:CatB-related O-acetyltransferase n=1 Tax=Aliigemmobacter aestuarii TaxID=1445661 RepID=A0A4S3MRV0_9RHOB|nr:CatB-related O-acetyltransferase [Gemmobacter aestuarii]THD85258.1 CatB-related O-acetyltransferase [Gemmobacter aestuarii]
MPFLNASEAHPMRFADGRRNPCIAHLARVIDHPNIVVGHHTYANDFDPPDDWAARLAPYTYPGAPERLVIGPFGQIAHGVRFVTASANHPMGGFTTYPFAIFDPATLPLIMDQLTGLPDTVIGPDVWIGHGALILPGARLGAGVIVGAGAVVAGEVPPYTIVAGNPARPLRRRFPPKVVERLLALAWWDWPTERIRAALPALCGQDIAALEAC